MHLLLAYLKFLLRSTNEHGVHSPFVFGLVTKCFYNKKKHPAYEQIKKYRKRLLSNHNTIKVTDFGAGSRVFSSEMRKISAIAKNAGISPKRARLLNRLVRYLEVEKALELGTSVGIGTAALAAGNKVQVTTIEGCPETAAVARKQFEKFGFENIELVVGEFDEILVNRGKRTEEKVESGERKEERERKYEGRSTKLEVERKKWSEERGQRTEENAESEEWKEERERKYEGRSTKLEVGTEGNSKSQIPNSNPDGADLQSVTNQPTAGKENSKSQIPNSKDSQPTTVNSQLLTEQKQQTTKDKPQTTSDGTDLQSVTNQPTAGKENSKFQIPNSKDSQPTTHNPQPTTDNKPQTTNHKQTTPYDLIFIDGNHQKAPTLSYFNQLLPLVHNDSVMIFDDIHWSKEMEEAWEEIKKHSSVRVTIDTFYQGFVFFRREQAKEHFVIRV